MRTFIKKAALTGLVSTALLGAGFTAHAAPVSDQMAAALAMHECVPGGPTAADHAAVNALKPHLKNTMKTALDAYRVSCARAVVEQVKRQGYNPHAGAIAVSTIIVETGARNLDGGDRDSVGLFQQRDSWGSFQERMHPPTTTSKFLGVMAQRWKNGSWNNASIGDVAADVQRPAAEYRYRYGVEAADAVTITNHLWGGNTAGASLSGDTRAEIVKLESTGEVRAWYNNLGFANMPWGGDNQVVATGATDPARVRFADLSGDGKKEYIYIQENGEIRAWYNAQGFAPMPWGGDSQVIVTGATDPSRVQFADLSGDGKAEYIYVQENGEVRSWYNAKGFAPMPWGGDSQVIVTGATDPARVRFTDLSGDGKAEYAYIQTDGEIRAWYNNKGFAAMPWGGDSQVIVTGATDPARVRLTDLSGDGKAEYAYVQDNGEIRAWYNNLGFAAMPWGGDSQVIGTGFTEPHRVLFV